MIATISSTDTNDNRSNPDADSQRRLIIPPVPNDSMTLLRISPTLSEDGYQNEQDKQYTLATAPKIDISKSVVMADDQDREKDSYAPGSLHRGELENDGSQDDEHVIIAFISLSTPTRRNRL